MNYEMKEALTCGAVFCAFILVFAAVMIAPDVAIALFLAMGFLVVMVLFSGLIGRQIARRLWKR